MSKKLTKPVRVRRAYGETRYWTTHNPGAMNLETAMLVPLAEFRRLKRIEKAARTFAKSDGHDQYRRDLLAALDKPAKKGRK